MIQFYSHIWVIYLPTYMHYTFNPVPHRRVFHALCCVPSRYVHAYTWTHRDGSQRNGWQTHTNTCGVGLILFFLSVNNLTLFGCIYSCHSSTATNGHFIGQLGKIGTTDRHWDTAGNSLRVGEMVRQCHSYHQKPSKSPGSSQNPPET